MEKFDFDQINLIPKLCVVNSRSECDTSMRLGQYQFKIPVIPANMECIINEELAINLAKNGFFYIMHRFGVDVGAFVEGMKEMGLPSSISIGVNEDSFDLLKDLKSKDLYPDFITIDIAHGHSLKCKRMIDHLKNEFPKSFIICGNVSSQEGTKDLDNWGADAIKIGIGPGMACTTYPSTGFGSRNCQASTILQCSKVTNKPLIADGGIRHPGDITKSLVMGASMVMVGGMLSGFSDSPGDLIVQNGSRYKEFWGSASLFQSGKSSRIEGKKVLIEYKDRTIIEELSYLKECIESSISYGGGRDLSCLKSVNWT